MFGFLEEKEAGGVNRLKNPLVWGFFFFSNFPKPPQKWGGCLKVGSDTKALVFPLRNEKEKKNRKAPLMHEKKNF